MKLLAFDISLTTGIAFGGPGDIPLVKEVDLRSAHGDPARFAKAIRMTEGFIEARKPDIVAIEAPIGGKDTSHLLVGLFSCVAGQAVRMGLPVRQYHVGSIRKHFLGKNLTVRDYPGLKKAEAKREIKKAVMARCRLLGWQVDTDNQADAAALLDFALAKEKLPTSVSGELFT